jgi:hypothetical protein
MDDLQKPGAPHLFFGIAHFGPEFVWESPVFLQVLEKKSQGAEAVYDFFYLKIKVVVHGKYTP